MNQLSWEGLLMHSDPLTGFDHPTSITRCPFSSWLPGGTVLPSSIVPVLGIQGKCLIGHRARCQFFAPDRCLGRSKISWIDCLTTRSIDHLTGGTGNTGNRRRQSLFNVSNWTMVLMPEASTGSPRWRALREMRQVSRQPPQSIDMREYERRLSGPPP